jgi:BRCT domain type II-containing protein
LLDALNSNFLFCNITGRVPSRVWLGLPNPNKELNPQTFVEALKKMDQVALSGFSSLSEQDQLNVVEHVRNIEHWAALRKKKTGTTKKDKKKNASTDGDIKVEGVPSVSQLTTETSSAMIPTATLVLEKAQKKKFSMPIPGQHGYVKDALLGKTIVLTGIFPEVGGGAGLSLGKDKAKALCQQFGARVTSSISGKTSLLLVGKEPGMSKVSKAHNRRIPLIDLNQLVTTVLKGIKAIEDVDEPVIGQFSSGYNNTGLALKASEEVLNSLRKPSHKRKVIAAGPSFAAAATATSSKKKKAKTAKQSVPPAPSHDDDNISDENANPEIAANPSLPQEYMNLTVRALQVLLKERGLKVGGNKSVLVKRLVEIDTHGNGGVNA